MTTKLRQSVIKKLLDDDAVKKLKERGAKKIHKWVIQSSAAASDAEAEIDAPDAAFDGSVEETGTLLFSLTKANTPGSGYLQMQLSSAAGGGTVASHYFWVSKPEITTITCVAKASCVASSSFHFFVDDGAGGEDEYYCWMNVSGTDPDPSESGTAIECDISGATTATDVAEVIDGLIDAKDNVGAANVAEVLTITNTNNGAVTDCEDGTTATGFTISIEEGGDDPSATGTGHEVDISTDTTAANVADAFNTVINGVAGFTSTVSTVTITYECDNTGSVIDTSQSTGMGVTITIANQGRDSYEGGYLYLVSASANDTDGATGHARTVNVVGWDNNGDEIEVEVAMNGTTHVKLGSRLKAVSHMYAATFGTGDDDVAGNITLVTSNTGNGTTLLTIAAGSTESNGARMYIPDGKYVLISKMRLMNLTAANSGATMVKTYLTGFEHSKNTDPDLDIHVITAAENELKEIIPFQTEPRVGTDTAVITLKEREISTEGNETYFFEMECYTFE